MKVCERGWKLLLSQIHLTLLLFGLLSPGTLTHPPSASLLRSSSLLQMFPAHSRTWILASKNFYSLSLYIIQFLPLSRLSFTFFPLSLQITVLLHLSPCGHLLTWPLFSTCPSSLQTRRGSDMIPGVLPTPLELICNSALYYWDNPHYPHLFHTQ